MKIVVTGAAGFLGSHLVKLLANKGHTVFAIVRPNSVHTKRLMYNGNVHIYAIDMSEYKKISSVVDDADVFFHLAWQGGRTDFQAQEKNILSSLDALKVSKKIGCKRFIGTGSQAEYGVHNSYIKEDTLPCPINAYGAVKLSTCILTRQCAMDLGLEWIWGRVFSVYGPYEPRGRMLPDLIAALKADKEFLLSSATQMWDYLYVNDCAEALLALCERGHSGNIYNIANGKCRPLREFVEEVRREYNPNGKITYGKMPGHSLQASVDKIYKDTGWFAKTDFIDGVRFMGDISSLFI